MLPGGTPTKRMPYLLLEGGTLFPSGEHQLQCCHKNANCITPFQIGLNKTKMFFKTATIFLIDEF